MVENDFSLNFYTTKNSNFINNDKIKIIDQSLFDNHIKIKNKNLPTESITLENSKKMLLIELKKGLKKDDLMLKLLNCDHNNSLQKNTIEKLLNS